jgi:hypothetical protein
VWNCRRPRSRSKTVHPDQPGDARCGANSRRHPRVTHLGLSFSVDVVTVSHLTALLAVVSTENRKTLLLVMHSTKTA